MFHVEHLNLWISLQQCPRWNNRAVVRGLSRKLGIYKMNLFHVEHSHRSQHHDSAAATCKTSRETFRTAYAPPVTLIVEGHNALCCSTRNNRLPSASLRNSRSRLSDVPRGTFRSASATPGVCLSKWGTYDRRIVGFYLLLSLGRLRGLFFPHEQYSTQRLRNGNGLAPAPSREFLNLLKVAGPNPQNNFFRVNGFRACPR
jgi:hypothetical protein